MIARRIRHVRFYRRQLARRNAAVLRELRRGRLGRLVIWFYTRGLRRREAAA